MRVHHSGTHCETKQVGGADPEDRCAGADKRRLNRARRYVHHDPPSGQNAEREEAFAPPLVRSPECFSEKNYFLVGAMTSLAALATRNFTTVLALILMAAPVWGLRPMRALRSAFTNRPLPGSTKTPFFLVSLMAASASRSRKAADSLLVISSFSASCRVRAVLVSPVAICSPYGRALGQPVLSGFAPVRDLRE